jgi:tetratricopeptide (TPR) repeat protein
MKRIYARNRNDAINVVKRCFFEAERGRVSLALDRIHDLQTAFPNDADFIYAEGLLRKDFLGQGLRAYKLFEQALRANPNHDSALFNATKYSPSETEFKNWAKIALAVTPHDAYLLDLVRGIEANLLAGASYTELLGGAAERLYEDNQPAESAAFADLALSTGGFELSELALRITRARCLRTLAKKAAQHRKSVAEHFPIEERLALHGAMEEMERALALDAYDPELWNLKSAWCNLLDRHTEAMSCADTSIELRPNNYTKPWIRRVVAENLPEFVFTWLARNRKRRSRNS